MEQNRKRKLEADQQPPKGAAINIAHFDLSAVPITDVSILSSEFEQILPQTKAADVVEYIIGPYPAFWIALNEIFLHLVLSVKTSAGAKLAADSKTSVGQLIIASLFQSMDIRIDGVTITPCSNIHTYASYLKSILYNSVASINSRGHIQGLYMNTKSTALADDNAAYISLKAKAQEDRFEVYARPFHGIFETLRYLPPNKTLSIKFRLSPNTFYLNGGGLAANTTFTDVCHLEQAYLDIKKVICHSQVDAYYNTCLNSGKLLSLPFFDYNATTFVIPKGQLSFSSENLMPVVPTFACFCMIPTTSFMGTYNECPYFFKDHKLANFKFTYNGEDLMYGGNARISVADNNFARYYNQLVSHTNENGIATCDLKVSDFKTNGYFILPLLTRASGKRDRLPISMTGSVRLHLQFAEALSENLNVIVYYETPKIVMWDKTHLFIKDEFSE